jgi:hypothetical protein
MILRVMATISGSRVFRAATKLKLTALELTFNRNDELGDDGENLGSALLEHVKDTLHGQEAVRVLLLADALEEDGQVVVVVELLDLNLPVDAELGAVLDGDGEVSAVVETTELRRGDRATVESAGLGLLRSGLFLGLVQADHLAAETLTLFKSG